MPEAEKSARQTWVVDPDAEDKNAELALREEKREMRRARWSGFAIGLLVAVVVLTAIFMFQHH
jgi:tetrahydromethanopterin S-methyltransferase subunit F